MLEPNARGAVCAEGLCALLALAFLCVLCTSPVQAGEFFLEASEQQILDFLLHKTRYDKRIRPLVKDGPLNVNVSVLLLSLSSPDESSLKYEVELLLHQDWLDPRLKHDDAGRHTYLSGMHHLENIWLPDTYVIMHGEFKEGLSKENISLKIYRDGRVSYTLRKHLILSCEGNLNKFPFDDPNCTFSMESISYEKKDLEYHWLNATKSESGLSLAKAKNFRALNAYLISNRTLVCEEDTFFWRGDYSCLMVNLVFTRDDVFYISTVFFPGFILVTSSFITFWLEWNAVPARVMIGVTTMLNFFTTSNSFRSSLPVVSNLSAMNVWDSVCMFFIYVSLLEFVVVNYVGRKRPKHNMAYMPGENAVIQTERKRSAGGAGSGGSCGDVNASSNRNSHELVSCSNCGNSQCSHANQPNSCPNGEDVTTTTEPVELSQVEYTFKAHKKAPPHPIRVAKTIDVVSRVVFPVGYLIFLLYFFGTYKGF